MLLSPPEDEVNDGDGICQGLTPPLNGPNIQLVQLTVKLVVKRWKTCYKAENNYKANANKTAY